MYSCNTHKQNVHFWLYKQAGAVISASNPLFRSWFTVSTSESGGWGHHYTVACPTYNSINTNTLAWNSVLRICMACWLDTIMIVAPTTDSLYALTLDQHALLISVAQITVPKCTRSSFSLVYDHGLIIPLVTYTHPPFPALSILPSVRNSMRGSPKLTS